MSIANELLQFHQVTFAIYFTFLYFLTE